MAEAYIIDACRTPRGVGKPGKGALSHLHPQHLAATVLKALKDRNNLDTSTVDDVIWSTSSQNGKQGGDLGRMAALAAGYDITASGMTLDRFCGGGITSVNLATAAVMSGMEDCVIAGGTEMMSFTSAYGAELANAGVKPLGMGSGNPELDVIHPQSHRAFAVTRLPPWKASRAKPSMHSRSSARNAQTAPSAKVASTSRSSPSTTQTAPSR